MTTLSPRLRHRVTIQSQQNEKDSDGNDSTTWTNFLEHEPAELVFLSGREYISAQSAQSEVIGRGTLRWRPGISASQRIIDEVDGGYYNIVAVLPDSTHRRWITFTFSLGVNDGRR
jgi:SPP1 family predicted phage head-tail adaptor